jgi:precorrin-6B methylase 2
MERNRAITEDSVAATFARLFIAADGTSLRREDQQKVRELHGLLAAIGPVPKRALVVDAAAGKGSVGIMMAALLDATRVLVLERNPAHVALARSAFTRLAGEVGTRAQIEVRECDVNDLEAWPERPDLVVALHACGPASDAVLDRAVGAHARRIVLVPCCYAETVPFAARATTLAEAMGIARHPEVRRRSVIALIDAERTLRLEAAGYETVVVPFVAPTVTPHNLAWRARWSGEPRRMAEARAALERMHAT